MNNRELHLERFEHSGKNGGKEQAFRVAKAVNMIDPPVASFMGPNRARAFMSTGVQVTITPMQEDEWENRAAEVALVGKDDSTGV